MRFGVYLSIFMLFVGVEVVHSSETSPEKRYITLEQAVTYALAHNPALLAMGHQVDADTARLKGHEGLPNPELSVEVEDFLGTGVAGGVDSMQATAAVSQDIPVGGRVGAIRELNKTRQAESFLDRQITEQTLIADVALAYLNVLAHQRRLINTDEMVSLAKETVQSIALQVEAGRATAIEVDKAAIVLSLALLDKDRIGRDLAIAIQQLGSICGETARFFDTASGTLDHVAPLPNLDALLERIDQHPVLLTRAAKVRQQQAALALEKANRVPDISLNLGYRWINATSDSALVAGVSVPLPFLDRNAGRIGAASHEVLRTQKESDQERVSLFQSITASFERLASEHKRASVLQEEVYPKVLSTFEAITEGYQLGRFGYLDLLDAQRTLFEVKEKTLDALVAYHHTAIILSQTAALTISTARFDPVPTTEE